jgi:hypothetical protein
MNQFTCPAQAEAALEALEHRIINLEAARQAGESPDAPDVVTGAVVGGVSESPEPPD